VSKKDFQNGFALGIASGGVVEVEIPAKEESNWHEITDEDAERLQNTELEEVTE
jgi:hypothetical protein